MNRRTFIRAVGAAAVLGGASELQGVAANRSQAHDTVWLDLTQKELDDAYDNSVWAPNQAQLAARRIRNSDLVRQRLGEPNRFQYGRTPIEQLEVFSPSRADAPILVFVHGGIAIDFSSVENSNGNLLALADQVRGAVAWAYRHASEFGGNPGQLYVAGHSSGAHLAAVALTTRWQTDHGLPSNVIKGGVCCSGIFDLKPVRLSARSRYIHFTDAIEDALSPQRHIDRLEAPLTLLYGTRESPEFQRQSREFAALARAGNKQVDLIVADEYNHFEILETLGNPYGPFGREVLWRMGLSANAR
jgi:arylformamidase